MIVLDVEQRSAAWHAARAGIPTASNFKRIVTAAGNPSSASARYLDELLREWCGETARTTPRNEWMQRGIDLEPAARALYERETGAGVAEVGLVYGDERRLTAASPDGLVGADGLLEIKCPKPSMHAKYRRARDMPAAYLPQVQGQLWVTGRRWCDFFSYDPDAAPLLIRVARDEVYIARLRAAVEDFLAELLRRRALTPR